MYPNVALKQVCFETGTVNPKSSPNSVIKYIDIASIDRELKRIVNISELTGSSAPSRARKLVLKNDVIVATVRPNLNAVACIDSEMDHYVASTGFCVLRQKKQFLNEKYLFYYCQTNKFINYLVAKVKGANYPAVSDGDVKETEIPLPPLSEQQKIAEVLEQADALRKRRAAADEKAQKFIPALFISMFGELGTNPHDWQETLLGNPEICEINPRLPRNSIDSDIEVSFLPMNEVDQVWGKGCCSQVKKYEEVKTGYTYFRDNDVLFAKITPCMENGKAAIAKNLTNGIGFGSTEFHVLRAGPRTVPEWLFGLVRLEHFRDLAKASFTGSAGQQRVPVDFLRNFMVSVPPFDIQLNFANILNQLHKQVESFTSTRTKLDFLFSTLLQRAFTGDLTAKWRESHMRELMEEMEIQTKELKLEPTL